MKSGVVLAALCAVLVSPATASSEVPLQPTSLETFVGRPTARIVWAKPAGRVDSAQARVLVTTFVVEDAIEPAQRMRGARIDLIDGRTTERVYLDESALEPVMNALNVIDGEIAWYRATPDGTPYRCLGAGEFWHPDVRLHTLNAEYCITPKYSGFVLSAYTAPQFRLPDRRPAEVADVLSRAIADLKRF
jgi:hypothetical protein